MTRSSEERVFIRCGWVCPWAAEPSPLAPGGCRGSDTGLAPSASRALGMGPRLQLSQRARGGQRVPWGPCPRRGLCAGLWGDTDVLRAPFHSSAAATRP